MGSDIVKHLKKNIIWRGTMKNDDCIKLTLSGSFPDFISKLFGLSIVHIQCFAHDVTRNGNQDAKKNY